MQKWVDREFQFVQFDDQKNTFPTVIKRLKATPARLNELLASLPSRVLEVKIDGGWSIKEHAGHLTDLEELWRSRLEDILQGERVMRAWDVTNAKTKQANHNEKPVSELLADFETERAALVASLEALDDQQVTLQALHLRLNTPMRVTDLFFFVAEHDDHHLASITRLAEVMSS